MYDFKYEENLLSKIKKLVTDFQENQCPNAIFREENAGKDDVNELAIKEVCSKCPLNKNVFMLAVEISDYDYSHVPLCDVLQIEFNVDEN